MATKQIVVLAVCCCLERLMIRGNPKGQRQSRSLIEKKQRTNSNSGREKKKESTVEKVNCRKSRPRIIFKNEALYWNINGDLGGEANAS